MAANERPHRTWEKVILVIAVFVAILIVIHALEYSYSLFQSQNVIRYSGYAIALANAGVAIVGAYIVYRILIAALGPQSGSDAGIRNLLRAVIKTIFYIIAIGILLVSFGVSLTGVLAGSAIGGIIIGLAVQTITSNILSGFVVSSSKTLKVGEPIIITTSSLGVISGVVSKVSTVWTEITNQYGNTIRVPNSVLLGSSVFTNLKTQGEITYIVSVSMNADVSARKLLDSSGARIRAAFLKRKLEPPKIYFSSKSGGSNTFSVLLKPHEFADVAELTDLVNSAFDASYWELKKG